MDAIDPAELDVERLRRAQAEAKDPAWRAAGEHGIDLLLLRRNSSLTPAQRMQQLEETLRLMER